MQPPASAPPRPHLVEEKELPAVWWEFIRFCRDLRHGEIEHLSIQDGVPLIAETTRKKVKFTR